MKWVFVFFTLLTICISGATAHANPCVSGNGEGASSGTKAAKGAELAPGKGGKAPASPRGQVGPFLQTEWGQQGLYAVSYGEAGGQAEDGQPGPEHALGCLTVAVAQIDYYFSTSKSAKLPPYLEEVTNGSLGAHFKRTLESLGLDKINKKQKDTGCEFGKFQNRKDDGLVKKAIKKRGEDSNNVKNTHLEIQTVLESGGLVSVNSSIVDPLKKPDDASSHTFIIDGYRPYIGPRLKQNPHFEYHINFGWGKGNNKWCPLEMAIGEYNDEFPKDGFAKWISSDAVISFIGIYRAIPLTPKSK